MLLFLIVTWWQQQQHWGCQLSLLAASGWIVEEPERWDQTSACKGALCCHFHVWSHLTHPDQWRLKSHRPWQQGLRPLLFLNNVVGSLMSHSKWYARRKENKTNGLTSPLNDATMWTEKGVFEDVPKILSCRINTSGQGIKQLRISFSSIFLLVSYDSSQRPRS